jgi:hypothetical protein
MSSALAVGVRYEVLYSEKSEVPSMRKVLAVTVAMCLTLVFTFGNSGLGAAYAAAQNPDYAYQPYAPEQLDNLVAPVALYPDPLLAQVLVAATFPDQIQDAAGWVRRYGANNYGVDDQSWDVSVKAVAHYPTVLFMMNDQLDWTTSLGQAYVSQSTDVMASAQHLRHLAREEGNLFSTPQQQVIEDRGYIEIVPAAPQFIFVPTYDPGVIYSRRIYTGNGFGGFFSFGSGFAIGAWLNYDLDWGSRRVVYDGWHGGGWRQRSLPYVHVTDVYVNNRYENVTVNRTVVDRPVNYQNVDRFNSVHHDVKFDDHARANGRPGDRPRDEADRNDRGVQPSQPSRPNEDFNRNRGREQAPPVAQQAPQTPRSANDRGGFNQGRRDQPQPASLQPSQPSRPNEDFNPGRGREQAPPAAQQPSQPSRPNGDFNRNRGHDQAAPPAPQQSAPPQAVQNQAPPQRAEQSAARPAPPQQAQQPQHGNQSQGHVDHGNNDHNDKGHGDKDHGDH